MERRKHAEESLRELVQSINAVLRKRCPECKHADSDIEGLVIMQFPKTNDASGLIHSTFLGRICTEHAIQCLVETYHETAKETNPLAT